MSQSSDRVNRTQELRRSNASQPHVTKVVSKQDAIREQLTTEQTEEDSG